jgi:hypothetical protein
MKRHCDIEYDDAELFCKVCGLDLAKIKPSVAPTESQGAPNPLGHPSPDIICRKCGRPNAAFRYVCSECTAALPRPENGGKGAEQGTSPHPIPAPRLEMVIGTTVYECKDGDLIGREGNIASDVFVGLSTVSRQHLKVLKREDDWSIVMLSDQTTTQLDGRPLSKGQLELLTGEHRLRLSMQCEITLRVSGRRVP